ncbi:uncharacterized protein LOC108099997 [Drosophila ficusphila]|uniref:uncharacterized protein LOC108099997 n=1 Tax=Drosophila ficusphila TaxID=30025 RepID=UPI001C8AE5F4|nr:uncharacterized protein LOC108099997 [Drosophila ficusphila]
MTIKSINLLGNRLNKLVTSHKATAFREPSFHIQPFILILVELKSAVMLNFCLWTTLPWIALGQTYYMSFVFNNYANSRIGAPQLGFMDPQNQQMQGGVPPIKQFENSGNEETLELDSMEHSQKSDEEETLELSSMEHSRESGKKHKRNHNNIKPIVEDRDSSETDEIFMWQTTPEIRPKNTRRKNKTTQTTTIETPEMPTEITTESLKVTEIDTEITEENSIPIPEITTESSFTDKEKEAKKWDEVVTPHPPEFFDYPEATCHEDMDLHEVFGIRLERDRGLPTKILCDFKNQWGGPWLLMTRIELPVRIHLRHWYFGYVTPDYKDININFLALAHIMNSMRTAMLIIGQDKDDKLVYNLYDDVVISAFNDLFMMRKAELVEANTTELLFVSVGKVMSSYGGTNRSCPLQVLGSWWGNHALHKMYEGFFCVFPKDRDISKPGYVAIFIKPSVFPANHTALYSSPITTRRPWNMNFNSRTGNNDTVRNSAGSKIKARSDWERNKQAVNKELARRARIFETIDRLRMEEGQRNKRIW